MAPAPGPATAPLPPGHPPLSGAGPGQALPADPSASIAGTVALAPSVQARVGSADVLYVIARNAKTNAVVAVRREEGIRFPHAFQVSSADLMMEGTTFTGPFDVTARVSKTGDAIPGKGDLEGTTKGVAVGARGVSVTIDSVRQ
jgi:cytochrome c-type biogenesis protein CcmH